MDRRPKPRRLRLRCSSPTRQPESLKPASSLAPRRRLATGAFTAARRLASAGFRRGGHYSYQVDGGGRGRRRRRNVAGAGRRVRYDAVASRNDERDGGGGERERAPTGWRGRRAGEFGLSIPRPTGEPSPRPTASSSREMIKSRPEPGGSCGTKTSMAAGSVDALVGASAIQGGAPDAWQTGPGASRSEAPGRREAPLVEGNEGDDVELHEIDKQPAERRRRRSLRPTSLRDAPQRTLLGGQEVQGGERSTRPHAREIPPVDQGTVQLMSGDSYPPPRTAIAVVRCAFLAVHARLAALRAVPARPVPRPAACGRDLRLPAYRASGPEDGTSDRAHAGAAPGDLAGLARARVRPCEGRGAPRRRGLQRDGRWRRRGSDGRVRNLILRGGGRTTDPSPRRPTTPPTGGDQGGSRRRTLSGLEPAPRNLESSRSGAPWNEQPTVEALTFGCRAQVGERRALMVIHHRQSKRIEEEEQASSAI
ncbi:hypothetical protein THAOC_04649 [Thalassiosira oceanica]|uniref:Uncharacterized protein n=1 Tax=Thalassiosira oceanica TaxID=159749 RepID=K0TNR1_THAOC|nr:hypothetical protein THAOC_04649 [Thalassiosira oceanica]|eukprot:EJK73712.1 hypothetical protein THAOC_04649 [Thalassiosira oceanica]